MPSDSDGGDMSGSAGTISLIVIGVFIAIFAAAFLFVYLADCRRKTQRSAAIKATARLTSHQDYCARAEERVTVINMDAINEKAPLVSSSQQPPAAATPAPPAASAPLHPLTNIPSGRWRGHYKQYGKTHQLCTFALNFEQASGADEQHLVKVRGYGSDDVGRYSITGLCNPYTRKIAFTKKYQAGTGDPTENKGHAVEYRGTGGVEAAHGFQGTWHVHTSSYSGTGPFHLWPAEALENRLTSEQRSQFCVFTQDGSIHSFDSLYKAQSSIPRLVGRHLPTYEESQRQRDTQPTPSAPPAPPPYYALYCPPPHYSE
eukprot:m.26519 g.26519  ORF g.26519 m.26519 type:complete len:316 (+) comp4601_c0_seq1:2-949(+)